MLTSTANRNFSNDVLFSFVARTDIGLRRSANEDAFLVTNLGVERNEFEYDSAFHQVSDLGSLLIVADGMGGAAAGDMANRIAVEVTHEVLQYLPANMDS